jgi:predicted transcriptional regulator
MAKTLTELAADIIKAQAGVTRMSTEELSEALTKTYESLKTIKEKEDLGTEAISVSDSAAIAMKPKASIQQNKVICLECGKAFKQLSKTHLETHGLMPTEYRKKHGFRAGQALTAKSLSAKRRKTAREHGLGKKLAAARKRRRKR